MENALEELGITGIGTYSTSGAYTIDIHTDDEFAKIYSKLENNIGKDLEYLEDISTLNVHTANSAYEYKNKFQITLIADWDNDEYKLVIRENK